MNNKNSFLKKHWEKILEWKQYIQKHPHKAGQELIEMAYEGSFDKVYFLLEGSVNPNIQDDDGNTALMKGALNGHYEIVQILLAANAQVNLRNKKGNTALIEAINARRRDCNGQFKITDIKQIDNLNYQIIELLLARKADVNISNWSGNTALTYASNKGYKKIISLLLKKGENADIDCKDNHGDTALIKAARRRHTKIVKIILKYKVNINAINNNRETAAIVARDNKKITELLFEHGAPRPHSCYCILI